MGLYLTRLPEDPYFDWRIHSDDLNRPFKARALYLTEEEMADIVKQYNDHQYPQANEDLVSDALNIRTEEAYGEYQGF